MKKIISVYVVLSLATFFTHSQDWKVISIQRPLSNFHLINENNAIVFGGDYIFRSYDGGNSWSLPSKLNMNVGVLDFIFHSEQINFVDSLYGWACIGNNQILKTINGGINWSIAGTVFEGEYSSIKFINRSTGWISGTKNNNNGIVAFTTNGGNTWTVLVNNIIRPATSIYMLNPFLGYLTIENHLNFFNDSVVYTEDNWNTVNYIKIGSNTGVNKIYFTDSLHGKALQFFVTFDPVGNFKFGTTSDAGSNWNNHPQYLMANPVDLFFKDVNTGWLACTLGKICKTTNEGVNWLIIREEQGYSPDYDVYDIYFKNNSTGWITVHNGHIFKTTNGGNSWMNTLNPVPGTVKALIFKDVNTGWLISDDKDPLTMADVTNLLITTNRGYNWLNLYTNNIIQNSFYISDNVMFMCGNEGTILKSTNGGVNFVTNFQGNGRYNSLFFIDDITGYVCGSSGKIIKTTNGGINWQSQESNILRSLNDIEFTDEYTGYIAADSGYILKTTNSGTNWMRNNIPDEHYTMLKFINSQTGFISGSRIISFPPQNKTTIKKTTNGGGNWITVLIETNSGLNYNHFTQIYFVNDNTGWMSQNKNYVGKVLKTTNGGDNWFQNSSNIGFDYSHSSGLNCIQGIGENFIWAAGQNGTILSTVTPIGIQTLINEIPIKYSLSQNYPNPFNPETNIRFEIPNRSNVRISIFDVLGKEISVLVNEELNPGTFEVNWDASNFPSGVYFYKIVTDGFSESKKMVLVK